MAGAGGCEGVGAGGVVGVALEVLVDGVFGAVVLDKGLGHEHGGFDMFADIAADVAVGVEALSKEFITF